MSDLSTPAPVFRNLLPRALAAASLGAACLAAPSGPGFAQTPCLPHKQLVELLDARYSEHRIAAGLESGGAMFEIFATVNGSTWTMVVTAPNGASCIIAAGLGWQSPETKEPDPET